MIIVNDAVVVLSVFHQFLVDVLNLVLKLMMIIDLCPGKWQKAHRKGCTDNGRQQSSQTNFAPSPHQGSPASALDAPFDASGRRCKRVVRYRAAAASIQAFADTFEAAVAAQSSKSFLTGRWSRHLGRPPQSEFGIVHRNRHKSSLPNLELPSLQN